MEGFGFSDQSSSVRKKRSHVPRRPRNDAQPFPDPHDISSLSSRVMPESDLQKNEHGGAGESDEASINDSFQGSSEERHSRVDSNRFSNVDTAPTKWKDISKVGHIGYSDGLENESNKVKKVKLKVGGVTRTIHASSTSDGASAVGSTSSYSSHVSNAPQTRNNLLRQDKFDDNYSLALNKGSGLQSEDFSQTGFGLRKSDPSWNRMPHKNFSMNQTDVYEPIRKSKRIPKRRLLDEALNGENDHDEDCQYLEELNPAKASYFSGENVDDDGRRNRKQQKLSRVLRRDVGGWYNVDGEENVSLKLGKQRKKLRSASVFEDTDYVEEGEATSDDEPEIKKKKGKEVPDSIKDSGKGLTITTRQRALKIGKDTSSALAATLTEFPDGLPPPPPKKQKPKLSELEQQLKRAEAAERRRIQNEKAARESEAEAIRKILGQDSSRKKREDKMKKFQEELAQEKAAASTKLASDNVRWVMGPSGTTVTFPDEMGLPSIFESKPCSYPPPREKCAGPACTNPYKYRDAKTKLPLCSLQCYKAIHEGAGLLPACG